MRKLGIIGGLSWLSTEIYYRRINERVRRERGGLASAPLIIDSLDFASVGQVLDDTGWERVATVLTTSARQLEAGGASAILIAANSMHRVYDAVAGAVAVPVIHVADCVGARMATDGITKAALLGTRNVMAERWYRQRLVRHGIHLLPPDLADADTVDRVVYDELVPGRTSRSSERLMKTILTSFAQAGAQAAILGCTELQLIVDTRANVLPIYDSTALHADAGAAWVLGEG